MKLRSPKGEGALTLEDLDGHVGGLVALVGRTAIDGPRFGVGGLVDRLVGVFGRERCGDRAAAPPAARRGVRQPCADRSRVGVPSAAGRDQRRALRRAGRSAALRRPHLHPPQDHARARRAAAVVQRRALSQVAGGDGAVVQRSAGGDRRRTRRWPSGSNTRWPISAIAFRSIRCRRARRWLVPAQDDPGRRARALPAVSRAGAAPGRARARSDREARSRRLLPDRLGHRQLLPPGGHPRAGPRLGGQQRRLLQPRHHRGRSGRHGSAVRALPVGGARRVAGHRSRSAERRSPRAGDPAHLPEVRDVRAEHGSATRQAGTRGSGLGAADTSRDPPPTTGRGWR